MIKVIKSGFYSTIQDEGRLGYRNTGVPLCGAMDKSSYHMSNHLLGNSIDDATLEITMLGPELLFDVDTFIVIAGADISPVLNDMPIVNNRIIAVNKGDTLKFRNLKSGFRAYLAVKGGFKTETKLGSRSSYQTITNQNVIAKGDELLIEEYKEHATEPSYSKLKTLDFKSKVLEVYEGPEFQFLSELQREQLFSEDFIIGQLYSRMAYQVKPLIKNDLPSILTGPVLPGTVQLTSSGQLIILMRDCQTTGGYPRVLQLSENAINLLSQKKERDSVRFQLIHY
ncbi:MAG: biotin-dependent carboxyltransferase [Winogradskyella sp.]|uniref:5-oxoprolinase subunit C family protein n=1 Tax=Winogradskyella sp. TaxID=1883156 RepID=UPI000F3D0DA2|nr:biotin-dependent carboxyltransferase family protein [Winogradskyella sp.]RNC87069.1 MAG: biotin-dependent carboxyltransferase [Winogradskyella sp.]